MTIDEWDAEILHDPTLITRYPQVAFFVEKARWMERGFESVRMDVLETLDQVNKAATA